jgi:hypothetical protein
MESVSYYSPITCVNTIDDDIIRVFRCLEKTLDVTLVELPVSEYINELLFHDSTSMYHHLWVLLSCNKHVFFTKIQYLHDVSVATISKHNKTRRNIEDMYKHITSSDPYYDTIITCITKLHAYRSREINDLIRYANIAYSIYTNVPEI